MLFEYKMNISVVSDNRVYLYENAFFFSLTNQAKMITNYSNCNIFVYKTLRIHFKININNNSYVGNK